MKLVQLCVLAAHFVRAGRKGRDCGAQKVQPRGDNAHHRDKLKSYRFGNQGYNDQRDKSIQHAESNLRLKHVEKR